MTQTETLHTEENEPRFQIDELFLFGSYNPPTVAHFHNMIIALEKIEVADKARIFPANIHVWRKDMAPYDDRVRMLLAGLAEFPTLVGRLTISDLERTANLSGFTVDTIQKYREVLGASKKIGLVIGADVLQTFDKWKDWQQILKQTELFVLPRGDQNDPAKIGEAVPAEIRPYLDTKIHLLTDSTDQYLPISSTEARRQIVETGHTDLVPAPVMAYIKEHHLYGT